MWTLSKPVINVFASWGGGCAPPQPPCPSLYFYAIQLSRQSHHQQEVIKCVKHIVLIQRFVKLIIDAVCLQTKGCFPPNPSHLFLSCARSLQVSPYQQRQNPCGLSELVIKVFCKSGRGGAGLPQPPPPLF